ncbi:transposase [Leptolyngbya sp. NK1-12]|uniref:transposase n=1 Tax=Leptolyngbya sp. NK1-12 TaxID=2547451 RepID=UPI003B640506
MIGFPPTLMISNLMKQVKGSSSHLMAHKLKPSQFFKWQAADGAFTVSHRNLDSVANHIRNHPIHHSQKTLIPTFELPSTKNIWRLNKPYRQTLLR